MARKNPFQTKDPFKKKKRTPGVARDISELRAQQKAGEKKRTPGVARDISELRAQQKPVEDKPGRFVREGTDIVSGITLPSVGGKPPRTFLGITPADVKQIMESAGLTEEDVPVLSEEARAAAEARERGEEVEEELGIEPLKEELVTAATPGQEPSLESPLTTAEKLASFGLEPSTAIGNVISSGLEQLTGKSNPKTKAVDLAQTPFGKALGLTILGVTGGLAIISGAAGVKLLVASSAKLAIGTQVVAWGATITGIGGSILGFGKILDLNRDEINEMVSIAAGMTIAGERAQALVINSPEDIPFVVLQLNQMNEDLKYAESIIQQKSIRNFKYAGSQEYTADTIAFRNARLAIIRRLEAVENIALTGAPAGNLDEYIISEAKYYE